MAKKTGEILTEALDDLLAQSSDIEGAAVVGVDGLVYASKMPHREMDEDLTGAVTAAIYTLSVRSVQQLKRGESIRTLVQGTDGNILVTVIDKHTMFVGLTSKDINLGMAFAEARTISSHLREVLSGME